MKKNHVHCRIQVNDAVFDEEGPIDEVNEKMRLFLDEHLHKVIKITTDPEKGLEK